MGFFRFRSGPVLERFSIQATAECGPSGSCEWFSLFAETVASCRRESDPEIRYPNGGIMRYGHSGDGFCVAEERFSQENGPNELDIRDIRHICLA